MADIVASMASSSDLIAILLVLAAFVATINHRFIGLPRAIALLLGSLGISGVIILIDLWRTGAPDHPQQGRGGAQPCPRAGQEARSRLTIRGKVEDAIRQQL
jgi:hypothetical protein